LIRSGIGSILTGAVLAQRARGMREETQPFDSLEIVVEGLTHATGAPFGEVVQTLRWVQAYARRCIEAGLGDDFLLAMERSGLGSVAESLLEAARRR
jgi:hypothetical protein